MIGASIALCFLLLAGPQVALAHGGVVEEDDICVIKVNYLRAHFKIYQPRVSGHEQFCEDLPAAAESVFVMEFLHDSLASMPIDFRIIRDVTGKGRFARIEDVEEIDDLDAATVYYRPPELEPHVYTVAYEFAEEGDFIGIVSARNPETDQVYAAVFPFEVGFTGWGYWPLFVGLLVLIQIQYLVMSGRLKGKPVAPTAGVLLLIALPLLSAPAAFADDLVVTYTTPDGDIRINTMHSWVLHIETQEGEPVTGADVEVAGGMPAHNHGLPTSPRVTEELGDGDYRLDGMRFHMGGYWEVFVTITTDDNETIVVIPLQL